MALRFQTNHDFTDVPIPTTRQPPHSNPTMRRAKTLTRPERGVASVPLINPQVTPTPHTAGAAVGSADDYNGSDAWRIFSLIITFWAPAFVLSSLGGLKDKATQQAWREKITLCFLIAVLCGCVGFATVGLQKVLCPETVGTSDAQFVRLGAQPNTLGVLGTVFMVTPTAAASITTLTKQLPGQDITSLFQRSASDFSDCRGLTFTAATETPCSAKANCTLPALTLNSTFNTLGLAKTDFTVGYAWEQVAALTHYLVLDGAVLNLTPYMALHPSPIPSDRIDTAIRTVISSASASGKDGTRLFSNRAQLRAAMPCLKQRYHAGNIDKVPPGCFVSQLFLYAGLIVILGLVFVRFVMACVFNWFLSERLAGPPDSRDLNRHAISPAVMPEGANVSIDNKHGTAPWAGPGGKAKKLNGNKPNVLNKPARSLTTSSSNTLVGAPDDSAAPVMSLAQIGSELFAVCLITAYSEGEDSLRTTLDSISATDYSDKRKLMFVVADGMITGAGEKRSTPDICVSLLEADPRFGNPIAMLYGAVGSGAKSQNRAMVYAGHYSMSACRLYVFFTNQNYSSGRTTHAYRHNSQVRYRR